MSCPCTTPQSETRNFDHLTTFGALLVFVFLIVAVSTNELGYSYSYSLTNYNWNSTTGQQAYDMAITHQSAWYGLWETTIRVQDYAGTTTNTWDVNSYCDVENQGFRVGGCDELRTIRGLLIWAVAQSFLTFLLTALVSGPAEAKQGKKFWFALASNFLTCESSRLAASLCVAISALTPLSFLLQLACCSWSSP